MSKPLPELEKRWMPALIEAWRRSRKTRGPEGTLTSQELQQVAAGVKRLSMGLTRERALAGATYMDDPTLLGAYLLFYWPVSYAQARHALAELPARARNVLDMGSGPGPVAFAAMDAGAAEVVACDRSEPALQMAAAIGGIAGEAIKVRRWDGMTDRGAPEGEFDLVTMGHVLNELWVGAEDAIERRASLSARLLAKAGPKGRLLVIEPALRETSRGLLQVRDRLVADGHPVLAPCLYQQSCPALVKESDWCHAERPWTAPALVAELGKRAGILKDAVKATVILFGRKGAAWPELPPGKRLLRIVSEPLHGKGRLRYVGCGPEGRQGVALQEKHVGPANLAFRHLVRGDVLEIDGIEPKGDGLALGAEGRAKLFAAAGKPLPAPWEWEQG